MSNVIIVLIMVVAIGVGVYTFMGTSDSTIPDTPMANETSAASDTTNDSMNDTMEETMVDENDATAEAEMEETMDIVDTAVANNDFNTLVAVATEAELVETLKSEGPFTVFAPTDTAFAALPDGTLTSLLEPANQAELAGILTYHVVPGAVLSSDLEDGMTVETVNGEMITIGVGDAGVTVNNANVVTVDIEASNGVIHVIDGVLLPE